MHRTKLRSDSHSEVLLVKRWFFIVLFSFLMLITPVQWASAETLEDQMNNLIGPQQQYGTKLSPVYLRTNATEESINPQSGDFTLVQTDYVLPGRNGLDLEIKRIYKSGSSNVEEMTVKYVNGAWVDSVESNHETATFYENRYNLGMGMRFSFPSIEIKENSDKTTHKFLHTESGDVYRLRPFTMDGEIVLMPDGQTIRDIVIRETAEFSNGQTDGVSKYVMTGKDGKKTYFAEDGAILGIVDRYGNRIIFENTKLDYKIGSTTVTKKLISKITDSVGRVTTIEYKEDASYEVKPISDVSYDANESYKNSQNPDKKNSGDLESKFQVIVHLPGGKSLVYDKTAALIDNSKQVLRTRLQRVFDTDGLAKYHYWYEQPELGFTFKNKNTYSAYNRYESLAQIDYVKINRISRYVYETSRKGLSGEGSMEYRKLFEKRELVKTGYDKGKSLLQDRFLTQVKDKTTYTYTNEADGYGFAGYDANNYGYLKDKYRYYSEVTDAHGSKTKYTYDGLDQLVVTEKTGGDHKEVIRSERDEMKLVKRMETLLYDVENGQPQGDPVRKVENFRYDEYGNLTNYTGPEAPRSENGEPLNTEHTVVYSYAYDKFHALTAKTWKQDLNTTAQNLYDVDAKGNVVRETKINTDDKNRWIVTDYSYDSYGNMTGRTVRSGGQSFSTNYEYGIDADGSDIMGAYLTREYGIVDGQQAATRYAYDYLTGNRTAEVDQRGNRTAYHYDSQNRLLSTTYPDGGKDAFAYEENGFANMKIRYTDPEQHVFLYEYDITGSLLQESVQQGSGWTVLGKTEYDAKGNKTKETDANGHQVRFEYDSASRLVKKAMYDKAGAAKGAVTVDYRIGQGDDTPLLVTITDEEGYPRSYAYDIKNRLIRMESTPDRSTYFTSRYSYDYMGHLITETDAKGQSVHYRYDSVGRLLAKQDALGNETSYAYNSLNQVMEQKEPGGKTTGYTYDALGRVQERRVSAEGSANYVYESYAHDLSGNVIILRKGAVTGGADRLAAEVSYEYDALNRLTAEKAKMDGARTGHVIYAYDKKGNRTSEIHYADAAKKQFRVYTKSFDYAGRVTEETGSYQETAASGASAEYGSYRTVFERDPSGNVLRQKRYNGAGYDTVMYVYDNRNQVTVKSEPFGGQAEGKQTRYAYDKVGRLLTETLKVQGTEVTTSHMYDGLGREIRKTDPLGNATCFVYDENGNRIKEIDPRYSSRAAAEAPGIEYGYDALNRIVKVSAYDGQTRTVLSFKQYDGRGNVVLEAEGEGYNTADPAASTGIAVEYDALDRKVKVVSAQTMADNKRDAASYITTAYAYDGAGNVVAETDAYGAVIAYSYYLNGLLKEKSYPDGSKESYDYDLTGKAWQTVQSRSGAVMKIHLSVFDQPYRIDYADGTTERFTYSPLGQLTKKVDQAGNEQRFEYDASGNLTAKLAFISKGASSTLFKRTELKYDEASRLLSTETFRYEEPLTAGSSVVKTSASDMIEYSYDKAGRLLRESGPNGREKLYEYDRAGLVVLKKEKAADNDYVIMRYVYDVRSQLVAESLLVRLSDLAQEELAGAAFDDDYVDRVLSTTKYAYNKNGQLISRTDAKGHAVSFVFDLNNRPVKRIDPLQAVTEYRYDRKGQLIEEIDAKGVKLLYEYDEEGRLLRETAPAADGSAAVKRYVYDAVGNLIKEIKPNQYETSLDNGASVLLMAGTAYTYDAMNRLTSTISPDGLAIEYTAYDSLGRVSKVVDGIRYSGSIEASAGTIFAYDGLGRMTKRTDVLGGSAVQEYDVLGNLTKTTDARGNATRYVYYADGTVQQAIYADGGAVTYTYDKLGRKVSETNSLGAQTKLAYNSFGQEKSVTDAYGHGTETKYDLAGNLVSYKDKRGSVSLFKYDANRQLVEKRMPLELDGSGNAIYSVETYVYDLVGNLIKQSVTSSKDKAFLRESAYTYYDNRLVRTSSDNSGASIENFYDRSGNLIRTEALRASSVRDIERFAYDRSGRMTHRIQLVDETVLDASALSGAAGLADADFAGKIRLVTAYEYDRLGNRTKETDPRGNVILYAYDALNQMTKLTRKLGGTDVIKQYAYDAAGNRLSETNELGFATRYAYDVMNRVASVTDAEGHALTYAYDLAGNKLSETNALGSRMSYSYDKLNRLVTVKDPYNVIITRNVYDAAGNLVKVIDARGYVAGDTDASRYGEVSIYDLAGRMTAKTDREGHKTTYRYNTAGELIGEKNPLGEAYAYDYDNAGSLVRVTDPLGVSTVYSYDLAGNKLTMTDGRGKVTRYKYGAFGLLTELINPDNKAMSYRYDMSLNIAEMTDKIGNHTRYVYDSRSLLLEQAVVETGDSLQYTYDEAGNRASMTDESGVSRYAYDRNNRVTAISKDDVILISYTYDAVGNVKTVKDKKGYATAYTYDKSSRMATVTAGGKTTSYGYDDGGNRTSVAYEGGVKEAYTFDKNNQLLTLKNAKPDGSLLSTYVYAYNGAGRQTSKTDSYGKTSYAYDVSGRITKVEAPGKTTVYAYDKSSNRQTLYETYTSAQPSGYTDPSNKTEVMYTVKKSEYIYSSANVLQQLVERMLDESGKEVLEKTTGFLYDGNGNELRRQTGFVRPHDRDMNEVTGANPNGDGLTNELYALFEKTSNNFDGFNRLKRAERIQGGVRSSIAYTYDGDGLRTQMIVRSSKDNSVQETNYFYDRQNVVLETNEWDAVSVRYVRGVNYIARIDAAAKLSYFLFNGHGDVVHTVSEAGVVENQYEYDIFGSPILVVEETYASSIRYAGEFYDAEVGLYYLRARYYDPYIGRFVSEDTYRGEAENPLTLNMYTYVLNNPLIYWDPTGHWVQTDKDLNKEAQAKIIALTSAYYEAQTDQERKAIADQAKVIRDDKASRDMKVVTPLIFQSKEIEKAVDEGVSKRGYMTAEEWEKTVKEAGFTTKTVATGSMWGGTSTTTTTTIGRTNLEVNSSYTYSLNKQTKVTTETSKASIHLSYNITAKETPFIKSVASKELSLEQVLVIYDTLAANDGEITKKQLEAIGIKVYRGPGGTIDSLEAIYGITTQTGSTLAEASIQYQEDVARKNLAGLFGVAATKVSAGTFNIASKRTSKPVTVNATRSDGCNCFTAGTKVLTDEGEKNIEDIEVGDMVLAKDEDDPNGKTAYKEVTALYRNQRDDIIKLHVGEQIIETTDNHPFWVEGKGWVFADELQVGDKLQKADGSKLTIDKVEFVKLDKPVTVYNFTVADYHTYYVTDLGIWVHNTECDLSKWNKGSFDDAGSSAEYHFKKHGKEVGAEDLAQYVRKAEEFARTAKKGSTKSNVDGAVEGTVRYKKNGKYVDIAPDGTIVSFGKS